MKINGRPRSSERQKINIKPIKFYSKQNNNKKNIFLKERNDGK